MPERVEFQGCVATFDGRLLTISNPQVERRWRIDGAALLAESFIDRSAGRLWITGPAKRPSLSPVSPLPDGPVAVSFDARGGVEGTVEAPSLVVELRLTIASSRIKYRFKTFPAAAGVAMQLVAEPIDASGAAPPSGSGKPQATPAATQASDGVERPHPGTPLPASPLDTIDCFAINPLHVSVTQVTLLDGTDIHNNLVFEDRYLLHPAEPLIALRGNVFYLEDRFSGDGLVFLKLAPLPHARPVKNDVDLEIRSKEGDVALLGNGLTAAGGEGYPAVTLCYRGGRAGRITALHRFQRQIRPYQSGRDGLLVSNTWGDRSRADKLSEPFMAREIAAAEKLGVDVVQIDDGWQRGATSNTTTRSSTQGVWTGFWKQDEKFWEPHPRRFPNGLKPIADAAKERGLQTGMWYAPDSSDDFANWKRDADKLLDFHRTLGIEHFKMDGVKMYTEAGQANLSRLYDTVLRESGGKIVLDQDVTAAVRPGYFGMVRPGPIFVENRYTDWHRYWPHQTLRNFWMLSQYVDPLRLRMEFLNNARNTNLYEGDPLAPVKYRPDYLFASVMFSSPLAWFEVSNLLGDYVEQVAPLVKLWKAHRDRIYYGRTIPIGEEPDGASWTGFTSDEDGRHGYVLLFRELNDRDEAKIDLPSFPAEAYRVTRLAGEGEVRIARGKATATIPQSLRFLWAEVEAVA